MFQRVLKPFILEQLLYKNVIFTKEICRPKVILEVKQISIYENRLFKKFIRNI
mgnify:CR=1 FL=1